MNAKHRLYSEINNHGTLVYLDFLPEAASGCRFHVYTCPDGETNILVCVESDLLRALDAMAFHFGKKRRRRPRGDTVPAPRYIDAQSPSSALRRAARRHDVAYR